MKEQLNNITRELEEIKNKKLTKEEQKKNERLYKTELKRQIKIEIVQEIETQLQQGESIKNIYNYLINNDDTYISNIIQNILDYKIIIKRPFKNKENKIEFKFFNNYPFKDFDNIAEDVDNNYYTILKNVINKYNLKNNIENEKATEELEQLFLQYYNNYGYDTARKTLFDEYNKSVIIEATKIDNQEYIKKNYNKILRQIDGNFRIANHDEIKRQQQARQQATKTIYREQTTRPLIKKKKTFFVGSILGGFIAGLLKISKN